MTFLLAFPFLITLLCILVILIAIAVESEKTGTAATVFSLAIALILWHYWTDIWSWVSLNPLDTLLFIGGYIVSGIIWSVIKWKSYISKSARHFEQLKVTFKAKVGDIGGNWNRWIEYLNQNQFGLRNVYSFSQSDEPVDIIRKITINANSKKSLIVSWIAYWPMSLGATVLNDPLRRLGNYIYDRISGKFQRMSENSAKNAAKGMEKFGPEHQEKK
ncbi:MAG: hypothetical protein AABY15_02165 [Nanoarchaeota archaeon]